MPDIQAFSAILQAAASAILVAITTVYVVFVSKMLHAPHRAFLRPISIRFRDEGWVLTVRNFGPGLATNIQARTVIVTDIVSDPVEE